MYRRRRRTYNNSDRSGIGAFLRRPSVQILVLITLGAVIYLLALDGSQNRIAREVNADTAYEMYQQGALILDVREQNEWDQYHALNAVFIPLGQLQARLNEVPRERTIIVVCRAADCSLQGRDILLSAGFSSVSGMIESMNDWYNKGYSIEGAPPQ